jgi:hypothetical protein
MMLSNDVRPSSLSSCSSLSLTDSRVYLGGSLERHAAAQSRWESYESSPLDGSVRFRGSHVGGGGRGGGEAVEEV